MRRPWTIAHRGAPHRALENTLASFEEALRIGVDAIELDVHLTKDGRLVVHHDELLGRTIEGIGAVSDFTLAELKRRKLRGGKKGERVPSLEEVFDLCLGRCHLAVEAKSDIPKAAEFAKTLIRALRRSEEPEGATIISFCHSLIGHVRNHAPEIAAGPSFEKKHPPEAALYFRPSVVVMAHQIVDEESAKPFLSRGIPIWVYTVDRKKEWDRLAKLGAGGIITNRPDLYPSRKTPANSP